MTRPSEFHLSPTGLTCLSYNRLMSDFVQSLCTHWENTAYSLQSSYESLCCLFTRFNATFVLSLLQTDFHHTFLFNILSLLSWLSWTSMIIAIISSAAITQPVLKCTNAINLHFRSALAFISRVNAFLDPSNHHFVLFLFVDRLLASCLMCVSTLADW